MLGLLPGKTREITSLRLECPRGDPLRRTCENARKVPGRFKKRLPEAALKAITRRQGPSNPNEEVRPFSIAITEAKLLPR